MRDVFVKLHITVEALKSTLVRSQDGQDLIEYALVAALIALGATASMTSVASAISAAYAGIGTKFSTYTR